MKSLVQENMIDSFFEKGYHIINNIYSQKEVEEIISLIENSNIFNESNKQGVEIFAIRKVFDEIPELKKTIFNNKFNDLVKEIGNENYFVVKSIYFDKPSTSNWFVPYHQDLTISVENKIEVSGYINWTKKNNQLAVQPPLQILENIFTIRIHLDNTTENNGAVKVISESHKNGIILRKEHSLNKDNEITCNVEKGGVMLMKPLTLHSSTRTTNNKKRRVLHIEFSNLTLPQGLQWSEYFKF